MRETERKAPLIPSSKPPFPTMPPLTAPFVEFASRWLELRCGCGHLAYYTPPALAADWQTTLGEVLPRLRSGGRDGRPGRRPCRRRKRRGRQCPGEA